MKIGSDSKFEETCDAIIRLAGEDSWDLNDLVNSACNQTGLQYQPNAAMAVKAMIRCGFLKGYKGNRNYEQVRLNPLNGGNEQSMKVLKDKLEITAQQLTAAIGRADKASAAEKEARKLAEMSTSILEIKLVLPDGGVRITKGIFHKKFKLILDLARARKNIFLYGPTGLGKSHICKQLAQVLGLFFAFIQCTSGMSEGQLGGRLLPTEATPADVIARFATMTTMLLETKAADTRAQAEAMAAEMCSSGGAFRYVISEFVRLYETGGVFLLDEIDAADPNVLLLINAALANGRMAVPNRPENPYADKHPDFICIAAANTVGFGADRLYSGRNKLDAATLDRFQIGKIQLDYDESVDHHLCPDDALRTRLLKYRRAVLTHKLERAVSTRFMQDAHDMKSRAGWSDDEIDERLFSGWKQDEVDKVKKFAA